jgi:hypothetical protein
MHLSSFLPALVASSASITSRLSARGEVQCLEDCVRAAIKPFVSEAAREGFRQSLGAHGTLETCMSLTDCRDTAHVFTEEIAAMVLKDRVQNNDGRLATYHKDGYAGVHCDQDCLALTIQTAAAQAGVVAMAVGQKHFYGNDSAWNRWSPRQILELDQAMRQLKGRNMARVAYVAGSDGNITADQIPVVRKFDLTAFRYNGTAEISLLHCPYAPDIRAVARKILSYIPGWGADSGTMTRETKRLTKRGDVDSWLNGEGKSDTEELPSMNIDECPSFAKFDKATREVIQGAYDIIQDTTALHEVNGFAYFLYHQRLYQSTNSTNDTAPTKANESWYHVLAGMDTPIRFSANQSEMLEDLHQASKWVWQIRAYGVPSDSSPHPYLNPDWEGPTSAGLENKALDALNAEHGPRLLQWVTDSLAEPLPGVKEPGYTHQPWTAPWFFEYTSNASLPIGVDLDFAEAQEYLQVMQVEENVSLPLQIRGYTFEMAMLPKAFRSEDPDYFLKHAFDASTGAVADFCMLAPVPFEEVDDRWPYVTAITGDGRAFPRFLSDRALMSDGKYIRDVLDEKKRPLYTELGKPIQIVYDEKTRLAEARYGRALWKLDWTFQLGAL